MAKRSHDKTADDSTNDADHHVHEYAISPAAHDLACDPTCDDPNDDPPEYEHIDSPFYRTFADGCDLGLQCRDKSSRTSDFWLNKMDCGARLNAFNRAVAWADLHEP
ncbi:MAG: hypothetical protein WA682_00270, partial [Acidobacteriaceae bacterium]